MDGLAAVEEWVVALLDSTLRALALGLRRLTGRFGSHHQSTIHHEQYDRDASTQSDVLLPSSPIVPRPLHRPKTPPKVTVVRPWDEQQQTGRYRNGRGYSEWW